ncbi:MAG: 30S ribosome-binding factor RbfA [Kiritimatiellaeota bacterium]|nr:30S ribosome-binding factor RbfA [Kiritimatiellota bacterium]
MSNVDRLTRVNALLKREIAESLYRVFAGCDFDFASVTVTHVFISSDLHTARVLVSILGHEKDRRGILRQLQQHHGAIQKLLSKHVILKYTPQLHFELDTSVEEGDHILRLLEKMEGEHPDWPEQPATPPITDTPTEETP